MIRFATSGRFQRIWFVVAACALVHPALAQSGSWKLTLSGTNELGETLIVTPIAEKLPPGNYLLHSGPGRGAAEHAQVFQENGVSYLAIDLSAVSPTSPKTFTLTPESATTTAESPRVALVPEGKNVAIKIDGKLFTEYRTDEGPKPFFYPLLGPGGETFTRSYPMKEVDGETKDHPHHRSLWFTFGKLNGIDFWAEPKGKPFGSIKETGRKPLVQGPVLGRLHTTDDWISPTGEKVCEDERILTVYHSQAGRIFDFDITIKATTGPVEFGETKEGMFGVRVATSMDVTQKQVGKDGKKKEGGKIVTSEGLVDDKAWSQPAAWVDYSGPVDGKTVGISILNHPSSFRYPTTWHVRTYGLFAANPFGGRDFSRPELGTYTLSKGQEVKFRYRVILHAGDAAAAKLPQAFQAYAEPPRINLIAE